MPSYPTYNPTEFNPKDWFGLFDTQMITPATNPTAFNNLLLQQSTLDWRGMNQEKVKKEQAQKDQRDQELANLYGSGMGPQLPPQDMMGRMADIMAQTGDPEAAIKMRMSMGSAEEKAREEELKKIQEVMDAANKIGPEAAAITATMNGTKAKFDQLGVDFNKLKKPEDKYANIIGNANTGYYGVTRDGQKENILGPVQQPAQNKAPKTILRNGVTYGFDSDTGQWEAIPEIPKQIDNNSLDALMGADPAVVVENALPQRKKRVVVVEPNL